MRSRPDIELHASPFVRAGETVDARIVLHEGSETPVNAIRATLRASEWVPYGKNGVSYQALTETAVVAREGQLTQGRHEYTVRFVIPRDAPLSHVGSAFRLGYSILVHVDIPWWPDARESFEIRVGACPRMRPKVKPHAQTTALGNDPFVELSLDDTVVAPGETLTGAVAAGHVEAGTIRRIRFALICQEGGLVGRTWVSSSRCHTEYFVPPGDVASGAPLRFNLQVPDGLTSSFESATAKVAWWFEARLERSFRSDLVSVIALDLAAFTSGRAESQSTPRALLGTDRWRLRWAEAGARFGLTLDEEELVLRGEIAGVGVHVGMDADGTRFAIALRYPSLGIGLEVARRRFPFGGVAVDEAVPAFGRKFRVNAREPAQARAILAVDVRRYLVLCDEADLGDVSAELYLPGSDRDTIGTTVDFVDGLCRALVRVALALPPPAAMAASLPAWARFAASSHGVLFVGGMRVEASLGGGPYEIATEFDDADPVATRISARIDPPLAAALDVDDPAELATRPRDVVAHVAELRALGALAVTEEKIELVIERPLEDPDEQTSTIASLFQLVSLLQGRTAAGPYR